ncbi:methyltransferase-like protein 25B [Onthophagus taurus]|uniref:methyltransferase-like protein 25B n=1 Tax=Onthophagus taurus TaxID=166361 RepID=UPI0039BE19DB
MAIPQSYTDSKTYMHDCLQFLNDYQWIYNYPNTHILVNKIFEKIPLDWVEYFNKFNTNDFNSLALGIVNENAPLSLKQFLRKLDNLKPKFELKTLPENISFTFPKNISIGIKKKHEILCLSSVVDRICRDKDVKSVLDVGCGLGYLPHLINEKFHFKVIGVEGDEKKVRLAEEYQKKYYPHSIENVSYLHNYITKDSLDTLINLGLDNFCITGLHACADLSITILKLFLKITSAKCLVIMPCCYHRLTINSIEDGLETFLNFPCSDILKRVAENFKIETFLRRPFLRLAAQQSCESWKELDHNAHDIHAKNCLFRAILQEIAEEG